jgi:ankyrin repeat protein
MPMHGDRGEAEGQTVLGFAAPECADPLVRRLLEQGASPNAYSVPYGTPALAGAALNGCPETVRMLLAAGARVDEDPGGGTPLQRLCAVSVFFQGRHLEAARLLVEAGAATAVAAERLADRLDDPGPGSFGFTNRPEARRILRLLRANQR